MQQPLTVEAGFHARWDKTNLERTGVTVTNPVNEIRAITNEIRDDVDILIAACHIELHERV